MSKEVVIFGIGRHAQLLYYLFKHDSAYQPIAYCYDDTAGVLSSDIKEDVPIWTIPQFLDYSSNHQVFVHVAIGDNKLREKYFNFFKEKGIAFVSYISSYARYWNNLVIGENCFLSQGANLQPFVKIGDNVIIMGASIGHHTVIGSHCLLSNPVLGGSVNVGQRTFIGMNAIIREKVNIGNSNIIGAGTVILKDTKDNEVYAMASTPARRVSADQIKLFK